MEYGFLASAFPRAEATARFVFLRRDAGCLVCGNEDEAARAYVDACVHEHRCPACRRDLTREEAVAAPPGAEDEMQVLYEAVAAAEAALHGHVEAAEATALAYDQRLKGLHTVRLEEAAVRRTLQRLEVELPLSSAELEGKQREATALRRQIAEEVSKRDQAGVEFTTLVASGEARVRAIAQAVVERFARYARQFVAEDCDLVYRVVRTPIAQSGGAFEFPRFAVRMTSAPTPGRLVDRRAAGDVSESQREFLDLAFRLAVVDVAMEGVPAMLVMETPEASLDAVFMRRAGALLGEFAAGGGAVGNRLIATSNLTNGEMISALFGAVLPPGASAPAAHFVPPDQRSVHLVDLLRLAAPSKAMRDYGDTYRELLEQAVYPERVAARARTRMGEPAAGESAEPATPPADGSSARPTPPAS